MENSVPKIITVACEGEISEVQTAIALARPNQIIQILNGFYKGFVIDKPGLTIEAAKGHDSVVILADKGDSINVQCNEPGLITLRNLKVAHTVARTELDIMKLINLLPNKKKINLSDRVGYRTVLAKGYSRNISQICLLRVLEGNVYTTGCSFSYRIMSKSFETITPGVVVEPNARLHMHSCEIIGHRIYQTLGVICQKATLIMEGCKVYFNLSGGISALQGVIIRY